MEVNEDKMTKSSELLLVLGPFRWSVNKDFFENQCNLVCFSCKL